MVEKLFHRFHRLMPEIEEAPLCAQDHPGNHFASVLYSLMRFEAIMPFQITRVMIISHSEWYDLDLTPVSVCPRNWIYFKGTFVLLALIEARYKPCQFLLHKWSGQLPHLCLWQTKNNFAVWGYGFVPVSSQYISLIQKRDSFAFVVDRKW